MGFVRSFRRQMKRNNKASRKRRKLYLEPLEPRLLLSADSILPGVAGAMEGGLNSFFTTTQDLVNQGLDFQTSIPGLLQIYRDYNEDEIVDDKDVHVPTEVTVNVDHDHDGEIDSSFFGPLDLDDSAKENPHAVYDYIHQNGAFDTPTLEQKLDAMDRDGDMVVDWGEAYMAVLLGGISDFLDSYNLGGNATTVEAWLNFALDGITIPSFVNGIDEPTDMTPLIDLNITNVSSNADTALFGHSFDLSLTLSDKFLIDLGIEADENEIVLPNTEWDSDGTRDPVAREPVVWVSETVSLPFSYHFDTTGVPPASLSVNDFNFATEKIDFSIDANEILDGLIVNVGFLGTEADYSSIFELNMDYEVEVFDSSSPRNLGFADEDSSLLLFSATETDSVLEAVNEPRAFEFTNDIVFLLMIGTQTYSPTAEVTVTTAGNGTLGGLTIIVEDAIDSALGGDPDDLITVDNDGTKLRLNLLTTDPAELGFSDEHSGTNSITSDFDSPQIGRISFVAGAVETFSFLLSVGGQTPKLVTVNAEPVTFIDQPDPLSDYYLLTKADLIDQVNTALGLAGLGSVTAGDGGGDRIFLSRTGTLEITRTLTMSAANNITNTEWTSTTNEELFVMAADETDDLLHIYLPLIVRPGIDFVPTGTPEININVEPFSLTTADVEKDDSGVDRFNLPLSPTDFEQYLDFNVIGPGEIIGMINQLIGWFDRLPASEMMGNFRVPFAQAVLGDILDFGDLIEDTLLINDSDDGIQPLDAPGGRLLMFADSPDDLAIVFGTAQELAARLSSIGVIPSSTVDYDEIEKHLFYDVSLNHAFSYIAGEQLFSELNVAADFDENFMDLYPLNTIYTDSRVNLAAEGYFNAVLGIILGQAKTIADATPLSELSSVSGKTVDETIKTDLALTGAADAAIFEGRLIADQEFTLEVITTGGTINETITIEKSSTSTNTLFQDLINDINDAIAIPGLSSLIEAQMADNRIQLVAIDPSVTSFEVTGSTEIKSYNLYEYSSFPKAIFTQISQLGLDAGPAWTVQTEAMSPVMGSNLVDAMGGATFEISINGGTAVSFSISQDDTNNTTGDLVDDLNIAINGTALAGLILAGQSDGRIVFYGIDESVKAFSMDATGINKLGFSSSITSDGPAPSNGQLTADAVFDIMITEYGGLENQYETRTVTVEKVSTEINNSLDDLVKDLNNAIQSQDYLANKIIAERGTDDTIVLESIYTGGYGTFFREFEVIPGTNSSELGFSVAQTSTATHVAGVSLNAENDVSVKFGRLTANANFDITLNDDPAESITILKDDTRTNISMEYLISDINEVIDATSLAGKIKAELSANFRIVLRVIDASVEKIALTASGTAITELGFGASQEVDAVLNLIAGKDAPSYVGLQDDAQFTLEIVGGAKAGVYDISMQAVDTYTNNTIFSLVGDVSRAIKNAIPDGGGDPVQLDDVLVVGNDGGRLVLTAKPDSGITDFSITADATDSAITDLKLYDPTVSIVAGDNTFDANTWDFLIRTGDGNIHPVSLDAAITIGDVIGAINDQTQDTVPGDTVLARLNEATTGLDLEDMDGVGGSPFLVDAVNGSGAAYSLGIFASDSKSDVDDADGIIEGENISILRLSDRLFFREDGTNPFLSADISLTTYDAEPDDPIEITANYGFVGVTLNERTPITITGSVEMSLEDPVIWNLGPDITLADLLNGIAQDVNDDNSVDVFDLATVLQFPTFDSSFSGSFTFDVTIDDFTGIEEITDTWGPLPTIYIGTTDLGDPFVRPYASNQPFDPSTAVTTGTNTIGFTSWHDLETGDTVVYWNGPDPSATDIGGLVDGTTNYVIKVDNLNLKLAETEEDADDGIAIDLTSPGTGTHHYFDTAFTPDAPASYVHTSQIGPLVNFKDITFEDFLPALKGLNEFLQDFAASQFLEDPLPMLGVSFNELVGIADRFNTAVVEIEQNQAASIQVVEQKIRESFGLPQTPSTVFGLTLVDNGDSDGDQEDMLRITLNLPKSFNTPLPIGIDLSDVIPGATEDISLLGNAGVQGAGSIDAKFTFGINLDDLSEIKLFTANALTGIEGDITAYSDNLAFNASLGQLGVYVKEGNADFLLDFDFLAGGAPDATIPLDSNAGDYFTSTLSGSADLTLPVFSPTQSDYVGDIDYDATFDISGSGGLDIIAPTLALSPGSGFGDLDYDDFNIFDNLSLMLDAGDLFLGGLQDILDGQIFNLSLPIIGDKLSAGADFIENLRAGIMQEFRNLVENTADVTGELIQYFLFAILGPGGDKIEYEVVPGIDLILDSIPGLELLKNLDETDINYGLSSYGASDVEDAIYYDKNLDGAGGDDFAQWNFVLGQTYTPNINIDFDLGLPALGLEGDVGLDVEFEWTLGLGLGISLMEGAYLDISRDDYATVGTVENDPELDITITAGLSETTDISGQLLFLQLIMDNGTTPFGFDTYGDVTNDLDTTQFFAQFSVDVVNKGNPTDENLAYSELGSFGVEVGLAADAEVNLDFRLQFNDEILPDTISALLPALNANFVFDWQIETTDFSNDLELADSLKYVAFLDVGLDLGSFLGDLVIPIVDKIQEVTDPLQPIVEIVTARIPLVSDVAGRTVTLVDLAAIFGEINPDLIYAIADIITFVNSIPTSIDSLVLPIGDFVLVGSGIVDAANLFDPNFDFNDDNFDFDQLIKDQGMLDGASQLFNEAGEFIGDLGGGQTADALSGLLGGDYNTETERGKYGFDFPLLKDPSSILGLLVGRPVTLITYDLPPFFMDFSWEQGFPVYPPLNVVVAIGVGLSIDLAFGYDTQGVADFMDSQNPLDLLSGLYISDTDNPDGSFGTDVPELVFTGSIGVGAELNLGIASAGVTADVIVTVNFDLFDPNRDGKVRITELVGNFLFELENGEAAMAPMAIFDIYGNVAFQLSAYIKFLIAKLEFEITPPIELFKFEIPFERMPILGTERGDNSLLLNIGPSSGARLNGNTNDVAEDISASGGAGNISVWGFGVSEASAQTYSGNSIVVNGGEGDDIIDLSDVTVPVEIYGGGGNDTIYAGSGGSIIYGGLGDDKIYGGSGKDIIFGEGGHDYIEGRDEVDYIFGDMGFISYLPENKERISSLAGEKDGDDEIYGGEGNDLIFGGGGEDEIYGDANADLIFGDGGRMTWLAGTIPMASPTPDFYDSNEDGLSVSTRGFIGGNDEIYGNSGEDTIFGSKGNDLIDGGADDDLLYGNEDFDTIYGGSGADNTYGGTEDDIIFGFRDPEGATFGFAGETSDTTADGADIIYGEDGNDYIRGNEADDVIYGNRGADIIFGDADNDTIYGQEGPDIIFGGPDDDIVVADTGNDIVFGDDGAVVYFDFYTASVPDTFIEIGSRIRRTADGHKIIGDGGGTNPADINGLIGGFTDDGNARTMDLIVTEINSTDGDDIIAGGEADDIVLGGAGHDWIGGDIPVIQTNEDGSPALFTSGDIQLASGDWVRLITELPDIRPVGQDILIGDGGRVEILNRRFSRISTVIDENNPPLPGDDHIFGDNGADVAFGGTADDVIYGGYRDALGTVEEILDEDDEPITGHYNDNDILLGDNGVIEYLSGVVERIYTSDEVETTGGADEIYGKEGNDVILGGVNNGGMDVLYGDTTIPVEEAVDSRDIILGDNGLVDFAFGNTDLDTLDLIRSLPYASDMTTILGGADTISGNQGHDVLIGGTGGDTMYGDNATAFAAGHDGEDIMLGDNADIFLIGTEGRLIVQVAAMPVGTAVDFITTTDELEITGGADTMSGNAMADIMLGGVFGDILYGDRAAPTATTIANDGDDILLGDNGLLDFTYLGDTERNTLDLIQSFEDGLGGIDIISGNKGLDVAIGGTDGDTIYGDDASASAAAADLGDLLLGDNADIFLVDPLGASGGDIKLVLDAAVKTIRTTDTVDPDNTGGSDTISGNANSDIIAGGVYCDTLYGDRLDENSTHQDDGDDIILGDNSAFEWLSDGGFNDISGIDISVENPELHAKYIGAIADTDLTTLDLVTTEQPNSGGRDYIRGDDGSDFVFGGTDLDTIYGDDSDLEDPDGTGGDDLLFGDHGRIYPQFSTLRLSGQDWRDAFNSRNFFAIDIGDADGGEGDRMWGEEGDDSMLGQQGDDRMWGGGDDDDMTGGHNVSGGYDELSAPGIAATLNPPVNDLMDGGAGDDAMAGDNAIIWRRGDDKSPRFRELTEDSIYTTDADSINANVETFGSRFDGRSDPSDAVGRDVTMLDHDDDVEVTPLGRYGNDVMAGGADSDVMFGELGNDLMQGDGAIEITAVTVPFISQPITVDDSGTNPDTDETLYFNIPELESDADDYMEGNGGSDLMYGGLGQDDMIGGSSARFGLDSEFKRPDTTDYIFGGAGIDIDRNDIGDTTFDLASEDGETHVITMEPTGHARDADFIMGDNANVYRLVNESADEFLSFKYDNYGPLKIIPRAMEQLDYTLGGADYAGGTYSNEGAANADNGAADLIHGESGDDIIFGMTGSDLMFGEGQDDDIIGGYGHDWISGGTGQDGVLGDDGLIYTSRNSAIGEPLYGVEGLLDKDPRPKYADGNVLDEVIKTPGEIQYAVINLTGQLKKTADLVPFSFDPTWTAMDDEFPDNQDDSPYADDIIFGGLGTDWLHGGSGDDAISGAEALEHAYVPVYNAEGNPIDIMDLGYDAVALPSPTNPGDVLAFNPVDLDGQHLNNRFRAGEFALYDEYDPRLKILLASNGELWKSSDQGIAYEFLLNFDETEGVFREGGMTPGNQNQSEPYDSVNDDGKDSIFGDLGNDWLVGGTGRDNLYGGWGNDLLNADDDHDGHEDINNLNDEPDTHPYYEDRAYGGAGRDVLIGNTGGDRLIDWVGEYNSYLVPYAPFGMASVSRTMQPFVQDFLYALSAGDGADPTRFNDTGADPLRNGEPDAEMGLVLQKDFAWQAQTGAPSDPQAGNIPGGKRDVLRSATFNDETTQGFSADAGIWEVASGRYYVEPEFLGGDALSVWQHDQTVPSYFELTATVSSVKPIAGCKANAYIVFDYYSDEDFKFAGLNSSTNKIEIGQRTADRWEVLTSSNMQIKDGRDYNLLLALNGTTATIVVNNGDALSFYFAPRVDVYGLPHNFNEGMVGLGANNAKASIDNVNVQVVPPEITLTKTDEFDNEPVLVGGETGSWSWTSSDGRFIGQPENGQTLALAIGELTVDPAYLLQLETALSTEATGGIVFDQYDVDDFKWAAYSKMTNQVMIGHYTARDGWVTDNAVSIKIKDDATLKVTLKGSTVSVMINDQPAVSHVFNAIVTDGNFGLMARDGSASFDIFTVRTDDPSFAADADAVQTLMAASAPDRVDNSDALTHDALAPIVDEAITRWEDKLAGDDEALALLDELNFVITDLDDLTLGQTTGTTVFIDDDAAGFGWFVDATPGDDVEFRQKSSDDELLAAPSSDAYGDMDLLSVVMHELGHVLGLEDLDPDTHDLMSETLDAGVRQLADDYINADSVEVNEADDLASLVVMDASINEAEAIAPAAKHGSSWLTEFLTNGTGKRYNKFDPKDDIKIEVFDDDEKLNKEV